MGSGYSNGCYYCSGTKDCTSLGGYCNHAYSCSINSDGWSRGTWTRTGDWWTNACLGSLGSAYCSFVLSVSNASVCAATANCGTESCGSPCTYNYCSSDGKEVRWRKEGYQDICQANANACGKNYISQCDEGGPVETCEVGYVCKPVSGNTCGKPNVDCVPKSSTWSET